LWAKCGKSTGTNQNSIEHNLVLQNGHGSRLPGPRREQGFPIGHLPEEGSGEYGDGNLHNPDHLVASGLCPHLPRSRREQDFHINGLPRDGFREFGNKTPSSSSYPETSKSHAHQHNQINAQQHNQGSAQQHDQESAQQHDQESAQQHNQESAQQHNTQEAPQQTQVSHHQNGRQQKPQNTEDEPRANSSNKKKKQKRKNTRASIKVASLNMRGHGPSGSDNPENKWNHINQLVREKCIGVLAIQEAHLTPEYVDDLHKTFGKRLQIHFSQGANANARGVAIVLNREITNTHDIKQQEIVPGRAMLLKIPWHSNLTLTILNVYAPNAHNENQHFWQILKEKWTALALPFPDILLGDFNLVEDAVDRLPSHTDPTSAVEALESFRSSLRLCDGWRATFPTTKAYSFLQGGTGVQSRIDRIYASDKIIKSAADWEIEHSAISTDHKIVSVRVIDPKMPFIGRGRWTMPLFLMKDKIFVEEAHKRGLTLQRDLNDWTERGPMSPTNPQTYFQNFKDSVVEIAKERTKIIATDVNSKVNKLKDKSKELLKSPEVEDEKKRLELAMIEERIAALEIQRHKSARLATAAHDRLKGETISKYWSQINKSQTPRDVIHVLEQPNSNPKKYVTRSDQMANLARDYHHSLLSDGLNTPPAIRAQTTEKILESACPENRLPNASKAELAKRLTQEEVKAALKASKNGTATGINGIPYEFWKLLDNEYEVRTKKEKPAFNLIKALTEIYNDIEKHGVDEGTDFVFGWMCPLYKKNDKRQIANYRPITLLNSDYKIFTKALATKLTAAVAHVIHPDQAGFIPGRSIFDQVRLTSLMVDYAEAVEENGLIIALDQEKAYDKVCHDYLLQTLERYNFPQNFIQTVQSLYKSAETTIIINGVKSPSFKVSRGVRQGDPLSCLLFDIAIEPLANMLRQSNLKGFDIPGVEGRLITKLFADDTTVYLSEFDDYTSLTDILETWCIASGARFNISKTEIIPIGSKTYRDTVVTTRKIHPSKEAMKENIHIACDKEPVRILGTWIGNGVDQAAVWSRVIDKVRKGLAQWEKSHPTLFGRRLIVQMVVGGMSQYLAKAQGLPPQAEQMLEKIVRDFIWEGKKSPVNLDTLYNPISDGGLKLLDIESRNKAIEIMWLKAFLTLGPNRPTWAYVTDLIIGESISKSSGLVSSLAQINVYLQTWKPSLHSRSNLPACIRTMLKTGKELNVNFESLKLSDALKLKLPIWYHIGVDRLLPNRLNNTQASKCLREKHKVKSVSDLIQNIKRGRDNSPLHRHLDRTNCACTYCQEDKSTYKCEAPNRCYNMAGRLLERIQPKWHPDVQPGVDGFTHTPTRQQANITARKENKQILFNPSLTSDDDLSHNFRVFTEVDSKCIDPAHRKHREFGFIDDEVVVYVGGSRKINRDGEIQTGSGVWYGPNHPENKSIRAPEVVQSEQVAVLVAVLEVSKKTAPFHPLHICSGSKYVINGLTKNLPTWEQQGWIGIPNKGLFKAIASHLRQRGAITTFQYTRSEPGTTGATKLACLGANRVTPDDLDMSINVKFNLTGAQLSCMSQALAYQGIRELKQKHHRRSTLVSLDITRHAAKIFSNQLPSDASIWHSIRNNDITRSTRVFLWKMLHRTHKCGDYWSNIPNFEHRRDCHTCGAEDSMEHILTECTIPGQKEIWELAQTLWSGKHAKWPQIKNVGLITGCGLAAFKDKTGKPDEGANRLYRIIISESAHLVWKLRCARVIQLGDNEENWPSRQEIHNRWIHTINRRLLLDQAMTSAKYESKALKQHTVLQTWCGVLKDESKLAEDWIGKPGVLVGIVALEQPQRQNINADPP
jgi:exonuclease III